MDIVHTKAGDFCNNCFTQLSDVDIFTEKKCPFCECNLELRDSRGNELDLGDGYIIESIDQKSKKELDYIDQLKRFEKEIHAMEGQNDER